MNPIRIVILTILFYILYRLLTGGGKKVSPPENLSRTELPAQDVLVEDPVCHTYIPMKQAVSSEQGGTVHYFCSTECLEKYTVTKGDRK